MSKAHVEAKEKCQGIVKRARPLPGGRNSQTKYPRNVAAARATEPNVLEWYGKNCAAEVNLVTDYPDRSTQMSSLGSWGQKSSEGRITTFKP